MTNPGAASFSPQGTPVQRHEEQAPPTIKEVAHKAAEEVKNALDTLATKAVKFGQAAIDLLPARKVRAVASAVNESREITTSSSPDKLKTMGKAGVDIDAGRKMNRLQSKIGGGKPQMAGTQTRPNYALPPLPPGVSPRAAAKQTQTRLPLPPLPTAVKSQAAAQTSPQAAVVPKPPTSVYPRAEPKSQSAGAPKAETSPKAQVNAPRPHSLAVTKGERRAAMQRIQEQLAPDLKGIANERLEKLMARALHLTKTVTETVSTERSFAKNVEKQKIFFTKLLDDKSLTPSERFFVQDLKDLYTRTDKELKSFFTGLEHHQKEAAQKAPGNADVAIEEATVSYYAQNIDNVLKLIQEGVELQTLYVQMPNLQGKVAQAVPKMNLSTIGITSQADVSPIIFAQRAPRYQMLMADVKKHSDNASPIYKNADIAEQKAIVAATSANATAIKNEFIIKNKTKEAIQRDFKAMKELAQQTPPDMQKLMKAYQDFRMMRYKFPEKVKNDKARMDLLKSAARGTNDLGIDVATRLAGIEGKMKDPKTPEVEKQNLHDERRLLESLHPTAPKPLSAGELSKVKAEMAKLEKEPTKFPIGESDMKEVFGKIFAHMEKPAKT
ncbi:MAG: hypothetical protein LLG04_00785 [Parachlamydia sp.]|nr:hypothetical protein [Parachlamydia sp.]